jgi:hypothetical protein
MSNGGLCAYGKWALGIIFSLMNVILAELKSTAG